MKSFRFSRVALPFVVAAVLAGAWVGAEGTARAQVVEVAPPALRVEVAPVRPSPRHFWIPGYWAWGPRGYAWYGGRWEIEHPGWRWAPARWVHEGRGWRFERGHYRR